MAALGWLMNLDFAGGTAAAPTTDEAPAHLMRNYRNVTYQRSPFNYIWRRAWITSLTPFL